MDAVKLIDFHFNEDGRISLQMREELKQALEAGHWGEVRSQAAHESRGAIRGDRLAAAEGVADGLFLEEMRGWLEELVRSATWHSIGSGVLEAEIDGTIENDYWAAIAYTAINQYPCRP